MSRPAALLLSAVLALTACSAADDAGETGAAPPPADATSSGPAQEPEQTAAGRTDLPDGAVLVPGDDAPSMALSASQALFTSAPVVVVAAASDTAALQQAVAAAERLGAPLLLTGAEAAGDPAAEELDRLGADTAVTVGDAAGRWAEGLEDVDVVALDGDPAAVAEDLEVDAPQPAKGVVALASTGSDEPLAAMATARAAGAEVLGSAGSDPRADAAIVAALADRKPSTVLALGDSFGEQEQLANRVATAMTGAQLPGGGQLILPGKRYVALYGHPGTDSLGVLGEQDADASVARAQGLAAEYAAAGSAEPVIPTFEIITTIASSAVGADGDYSDESSIEHLRPYVDAAARSGTYVVLDLQPGYTDFLTQVKRYEELLALPHVGVALDPEWRLRPGERHMKQIGRVSAAEVNAVVDWLATFTRERDLPQKMLLLHQFKTFMLENREQIDATRDELAVITQMDGHGAPSTKMATWDAIRPGAPAGMTFGWKNFYDEDSPTLTPAQTLAVQPTPVFISYQ